MKEFANLYVDELKPTNETLTLKMFTTTALSLVVVFALLSIVLQVFAGQQKSQFIASAEQSNQLENQLRQRQEVLQVALSDSSLNGEIDALQQELMLRQRLWSKMQALTGRNRVNFSQLLVDLAVADQAGIWLQQMIIDNDALTLKGQTLTPQQLPAWLASFSDYQTLKGRPFGVFELRDEGDRGLHFTVGHLQYSDTSSAGSNGGQQ